MDGLETKRDLELAIQPVAKPQATIPDQGRVALDDDAVKLGQTLGDGSVFAFRDRLVVEETAGVVKFDLAQLGQVAALAFRLAKREVDLPGDRAGGHGFVEGLLPEVAH